MSKTTKHRYIICSNCNIIIQKYYHELGFEDIICIDCLCEANDGYPVGKSVYVPCKYCIEPNIIWFEKKLSNGDEIDGCYIHNTICNIDEDYQCGFTTMFD